MRKTILAQLFNLLYPRLWLQHDQNIANSDGATVRADINNALGALFSNSSGATAPSTTIAYQLWADTTTGLLKVRNAANTNWVTIGTLASTNLGLAALSGASFTGAISGTTAAFTKAAAGDVVTITNGGATPKTAYIYSGSTQIAFCDGVNTNGNGLFVDSANNAVYLMTGTGNLQLKASNAGVTTRWVTVSGSNGANPIIDVSAGALALTPSGASVTLCGAHTISTGTVALGSGTAITGVGDMAAATLSGACIATQAQMEAASSTAVVVTPGRVQYHPGVAKAFCAFDVAGSIGASYNVTSVTDSGTGDWTVNLTTAFSSANFAATAGANTQTAGTANRATGILSQTASTIRMQCEDSSGSAADPSSGYISVSAFGDQ